jgi:hypothetical protein
MVGQLIRKILGSPKSVVRSPKSPDEELAEWLRERGYTLVLTLVKVDDSSKAKLQQEQHNFRDNGNAYPGGNTVK